MHTRLVAGVIAVFAISNVVVSADQERPHFEVPPKESAKADELANQLAGLHGELIQTKRSSWRNSPMLRWHG